MEHPNLSGESFTYGDYLKWPDDERWELIEGRAYAMTPSPSLTHQVILGRLFVAFNHAYQGKPCQVLLSPLDVRLPETEESDESVDTVVQPDLMVVCDPAKIDAKGVHGAPDLVIEILSPGSVERDQGEKLRLYERHGVRCYLIVDPWSKTIIQRSLESEAKFGQPQIFTVGQQMPIAIFPELLLELSMVFAEG